MALIWLVTVALVSGCSEKPGKVIGEIRGEPINSRGASNSVPVQQAVPAERPDKGYTYIGFDKLSSFKFDPGEELLNPQTNAVPGGARSADALIPERVKAFSEKRAAVRGFMLPLRVEGGLVKELLIMRDQSMCCYGVVPKINEWISVKMQGKGVKAIMDQPVTLYGTIHIGEMRENGYLVGIFALDGEKMDLPEN